jgi:hypothetical protein
MLTQRPYLRISSVVGIVFCSLMFGCALHRGAPSPESLHQALLKRIDQLYKARMAKNHDAVYDIADTAYRQKVTRAQFQSKLIPQITSYKVLSADVKGNKGNSYTEFVAIKMGYPFKLKVHDTWLLEDGVWRLNLTQESRITPFGPKKK